MNQDRDEDTQSRAADAAAQDEAVSGNEVPEPETTDTPEVAEPENTDTTDTEEAAAPDAQLRELKQQLEELTQKNAELNDQLLRQYAEFGNYKKRTAKEKEEIADVVKIKCIQTMLEVLDNFERALASESSDAEFRKGVDMIFHQFSERIKALGATEIEALGKEFDPQLHNAVSQIESEEYGENTVCQVLQKGYLLGSRVIRHAVVVVANP